MKYVVVWEPPAERDLTVTWLGSRMRHVVSRAADEIDAELERKPHDCGESREGGRRVMFVWPLGVSFKIDEDRQEVRIISVWHI
jgi:plasmid stabilization system protein ParE